MKDLGSAAGRPSMYLLAASCLKEATPPRDRKIGPRITFQVTRRTEFPHRILEEGSLISIGLPLLDSDFVVIRTSTGGYALAYRVHFTFFLKKSPLPSTWVVLPIEGVDIVGNVESITLPKAKGTESETGETPVRG